MADLLGWVRIDKQLQDRWQVGLFFSGGWLDPARVAGRSCEPRCPSNDKGPAGLPGGGHFQ